MKTTLFDTGDRKKKTARRPPPTPHTKPVPPALIRAAVAATLADALAGLPHERRAAVLAKTLFVLKPWELDILARMAVDLIRAEAG